MKHQQHISNTSNVANSTSSVDIIDTTTVDANSYYDDRKAMIKAKKEAGINPYPHKFNQTMTLVNFAKTYDNLKPTEMLDTVVEGLTGRVEAVRDYKKLFFCTIVQDDFKLQFMFNLKLFKSDKTEEKEIFRDFSNQVTAIKRGDIIGAVGYPGRTKTGELSLMPFSFQILTPCLRMLPSVHFGLTNEEMRQRKRYLDFIVNPQSKHPFKVRNTVISFIRKYLNDRDFMEVETPILTGQAGGAIAKPFTTFRNDGKENMVLRIATELYLKQLVVGGFDRVYEIGKQFRNESIDRTHSPEFTSVEFYMAYADYNDLIVMAEEIFSGLAMAIHGSYKIKCKPFDSTTDEEIEVDFTPPFAKFDFLTEIEKGSGKKLPSDLGSDETRMMLEEICSEFKIECSPPRTNSRLLDKLAGHFIEPKCINPSFIVGHPLEMSPLAKPDRNDPRITERFELFMLGYEFSNAYTELNDPEIQRKTFEKQALAKINGDEEAQPVDEIFLDALEYGLPPTGGFGIGIDRLAMLLSGVKKIQDVILFPIMNSV